MINKYIEQIYAWLILTVLGLIVVHAPLQAYFGSVFPDVALYVKAWKEVLMLLAIPIAIAAAYITGSWRTFLNDKLLWLVGVYALIHILALMQWNGIDASLAGLAIDLRYLLFFVLMYCLVTMFPSWRSRLLRVAVVGACVVVGFGMLQTVLPADFLKHIGYGPNTITPYTTIDKNPDFIRYQSTLRGPNPFGAYAASVAVIAGAIALHRFRLSIAILAFAAVIATYLSHSRSAFIALAVGAAIVGALHFRKKLRPAVWATVVVLAVVSSAGLYMLRDSYFVSNVLLHEDPHGGSAVSSNDEHLESLLEGTESVIEDPLGDGVGSTGSASLLGDSGNIIENQYLMIAHEAGWAGLVVFIAIFIIVMIRLWKRRRYSWVVGLFATGVGLSVVGILLPVWADDTVSIVWWGLTGIALTYKQNYDNIKVYSNKNEHERKKHHVNRIRDNKSRRKTVGQ